LHNRSVYYRKQENLFKKTEGLHSKIKVISGE